MALDSIQKDFLRFDRALLAAEVEDFCVRLQASLRRAQDADSRSSAISCLRQGLSGQKGPFTLKALESLFLRHVLLDLSSQGWSVVLTIKFVTFKPGDKSEEVPAAAKDRIRQQHLQERDAQLPSSSSERSSTEHSPLADLQHISRRSAGQSPMQYCPRISNGISPQFFITFSNHSHRR